MSQENTIHVVMLPWSAFGHLTPFFHLSTALAKSGVHVSFISTPRNIQRLPKIPSSLSRFLDFVEIPLPSLENENELLPEDAEATMDIPVGKIQYLKAAYDLLQHPVRKFIAKQPPDWIICDFSPYWVVQIAQDFQVNLIFFNVIPACAVAFFGPPEYLNDERRARLSPKSFTVTPEWVTFPSTVAYRPHEAAIMHPGFRGENASGISDSSRIAKIHEACQALVFRSCYEIEGEYLKLYQKISGKPVVPVGLLPPDSPESDNKSSDSFWDEIFEWLDEQETRSVVFVGFGSECKLSEEQIHEIAYGLELSGLPFLWALRKPNWANEDHDSLPLGFIERTSRRVRVCSGWAPQQKILAHPSIGGSLFHSGWGSIIESLQFGHNLVVLPFIIDQPLNARFLVDKGLAIEVERSEEGSFSREDIAKALREAMVLGKGESMRIKTSEAAAIIGDEDLQNHYMASFVHFLKSGITKDQS